LRFRISGVGLQLIADDLAEHDWYVQLVDQTIAALEAFLARWAAFEDFVSGLEA
jgi:hypothetical protein